MYATVYHYDFYLFNNHCSVSELFVDNPSENDRLGVNVNITLPRMRCECKYILLGNYWAKYTCALKYIIQIFISTCVGVCMCQVSDNIILG